MSGLFNTAFRFIPNASKFPGRAFQNSRATSNIPAGASKFVVDIFQFSAGECGFIVSVSEVPDERFQEPRSAFEIPAGQFQVRSRNFQVLRRSRVVL
jgi:hypothetical protein